MTRPPSTNCNQSRSYKTLPGCLFRRPNNDTGRWYWKVKLSGWPAAKIIRLVAPGKSFATRDRDEAEGIARMMLARNDGTPPRMEALIERYLAETGGVKKYLSNKRFTIRAFVTRKGIDYPEDMTGAIVKEHMADLEADGLTPKTRWNKRGILHDFGRWLREAGELAANPVDGVPSPVVPREKVIHMTREMLADVLKVAQRYKVYHEVVFAAYTGARRGQLAGLKWSDIIKTGDDTLITFYTRKGRKGQLRAYTILAHPKLVELIEMLPHDHEPFVFRQRAPEQWVKQLKPIRRRFPLLNRKGGGWHDFRRTVGSLLLQSGQVNIEDVSAVLGHSNIQTTQNYYADLDSIRSSRRVMKIL